MNMLVRQDQTYQVKFFEFKRGDRIEDKHRIFSWVSTSTTGYWFQRVDDVAPPEFYSFEEISRGFDRKRDPMGYLPCRRSAPEGDGAANELLSGLKPQQQTEVLEKHAWCMRFLAAEAADPQLSRSDASLEKYIAETQDKLEKEADAAHKAQGKTHRTKVALPSPPSGRSLRRWVQHLEEGNFDPVALLNKNSAAYRKDYFTPDELEHINKYVRMAGSSDRLPIKELHRLLGEAIDAANVERRLKNKEYGAVVLKDLRIPNIDTFSDRIHKLPRSHVALGHRGRDHAHKHFSVIMGGVDVLRPLERVEIDECIIDLQTPFIQAEEWNRLTQKERDLIERIRLYATVAYDVATKCVVGLRFHHSAPSAASAVATLEMVTRDKTELAKSIGCVTPWDMDGVPDEVPVDSATWLASAELRIATNDIGAALFQPRAGDASARGSLERFMRTLNRQALLFFTGRTWGSSQEKGDYDAVKEASIAFDQAAELMMRFVVDVYHNTPHDGLNGEKPRDAWLRLRKFHKPTPPLSPRVRRSVFGIKLKRKISRSGVRVLGIQYSSSKLQSFFRACDQEVEVRFDRFDLGAISVRLPEGWVTVPAVHDEVAGMTLWKWLAFNQRLNLVNKKNAEVSSEIVRDTKNWLREQALLARAEAELGSAVLTERDILRFEKKAAWSVTIVERQREEAQQPGPVEMDVSSLIKAWDLHGIQQAAQQAAKPVPVVENAPKPSGRNKLDPSFDL
ncbi:Mu transposase C-terminal domain-containing protein [Neorhizobium alkalisoli]|uniref:Mu transposase C-terminal domain-containing protein n=1 Tax=Neorhizobium alkalisoli TaxID=528178 RepID=UPI00131A094F|nr:Mu transposase C-terminal domain-containing protein [Neorhizobium alkalisoli]